MDADALYGNIQALLRMTVFLFLLQKPGLYRNHLLYKHFPLDGFKTDFPYTAEPIIIIRFCEAVAGTPIDNAHASQAVLAFPDLGGPFLKPKISGHHRCF